MNFGVSLNEWHSGSSEKYLRKNILESDVIEILLTEDYKIPVPINKLLKKWQESPPVRLHINSRTKDKKTFSLNSSKLENIIDRNLKGIRVKAIITHPFHKETPNKEFEDYIDQLYTVTSSRGIRLEIENGALYKSKISGFSGEAHQDVCELYNYIKSKVFQNKHLNIVYDFGKSAEHIYYNDDVDLKNIGNRISNCLNKCRSRISGLHICEKVYKDEKSPFQTVSPIQGGIIGTIDILKGFKSGLQDVDCIVETNEEMKEMYQSLKFVKKNVRI